MAVGILRLELRLMSPHSLKEKRAIINPLKNYLRKKKNVSVAEIDYHDIWQSAVLEVAMACNHRAKLKSNLDSIQQIIENRFPVEVSSESIEIV